MTKKKDRNIIPIKRRIKTVSITISGTALAITLFIFASNFVVDGQFILRGGTLVVENAPAGTQILIDYKVRAKSNTDSNPITIKKVKPGKRSVIVIRDGHWPWVAELDMQAGKTRVTNPILIPQEVTAKIVEDTPANLDFSNTRVQRGSLNIWAHGASIYMQATSTGTSTSAMPIAIFTAEYPVQAIALYPRHTDTLLVAAGNLIFALDINKDSARNFLPIYKSTAPTFAINEESGTIFVQDGDKILELQL